MALLDIKDKVATRRYGYQQKQRLDLISISKESRINIVQNNYLSSVDKVDCQVYEFGGYFDPAETLDQAFSARYSKNGKAFG